MNKFLINCHLQMIELEGELTATICTSCCDQLNQLLKFKEQLIENNKQFQLNFYAAERIKNKIIGKISEVNDINTTSNLKRKLDEKEEEKCSKKFKKDEIEEIENNLIKIIDIINVKEEIITEDAKFEDFFEVSDELITEGGSSPFKEQNSPAKVEESPKKIQCELCKKLFSKPSYLLQHKKIAHENLNFRCKKCGKKFPTKQKLSEHAARHLDGAKTFHCTICSKSFFHNFDLKRHFQTHSKNFQFECSLCYKGFPRKDHLNKHMNVHFKSVNNVN